MFLGVALTSYGVHFLAKTGTCSGTGYVSYGPVPRCSGNEALYIMSAFFVGPVAALAGWLLAQAWGWLWPTFCAGVGAVLIAIYTETTAATGARAFGLVGGICLFALAGLSVIVSLRKRRRPPKLREAAGPGTTVLASTPAPARLAPAGARAATGGQSDPFDKIAKLAQLRDAGALTEDEFEIQKAKLLAQI
jgi:Short C-terminal domain